MNRIIIKNAIAELEKRRCRNNPLYFATKYCLTLDSDDIINPVKPFPAYPYLKTLFHRLSKGTDIHIEKSRQMLISWSIMLFFLHQVLFKKNVQLLVVSAKQELVDDGGRNSTVQSLFGKIRFAFNNLPAFLKNNCGDNYLKFKQMQIASEHTKSSIKGEAAVPNAGRGGNFTMALIDEAAFIPNSEAVFTSTRLACKKGIVLCSTPNGRGNVHWRIKYGAKNSGFVPLRFHWSDHPLRDDRWYQERCKSMTDLQIARELDISYESSTAGIIYNEFDYKKHVSTYRLSYNPDLPLCTTWDFGIGDPTSILFIQTDSNEYIYVIDEYEDRDKDSSFYAAKLIEIIESWGMKREKALALVKESDHYGDPAGHSRGPRLESWTGDLYQRLGIVIQTRRKITKMEKINRVKVLLREGKIIVSPHCTNFIEALQNYARMTDKNGKVISEKPVHNWASHSNDAFQEFCINRYPRRIQKIEAFRIKI